MAIIFSTAECSYCQELRGKLEQAGLKAGTDYSEVSDPSTLACKGFTSTPSTQLDNGKCLPFSTCAVQCQYDAILAEHDGKQKTEPNVATTPVATAAQGGVWSEEVSIKWGGVTTAPKKTYEDLDVTSTVPVPPEVPIGLTIALRDHKKAPVGRKIA
jgi:hypothetical protein